MEKTSGQQFQTPQKCVKSIMQVAQWEKSEAYHRFVSYILSLNNAVKGVSNLDKVVESTSIGLLMELLDKLDSYIELFPPLDMPQRFGNVAFRNWSAHLSENVECLVNDVLSVRSEMDSGLSSHWSGAAVELCPYLLDSFGNSTRIDYGTGHEASFIMFLCCLHRVGFLEEADFAAIVTTVFARYLELVRRLQVIYKMEPAGSQGVWSLDDHQFVAFLWGSSQLIGHPQLEPNSFVKSELVERYANEFLFMGCIKHINQVKSGPFSEHSNQLWNISAVQSWIKVNSGLVKMYQAEVLRKFPVAQHFLFGSLLPFRPKDV